MCPAKDRFRVRRSPRTVSTSSEFVARSDRGLQQRRQVQPAVRPAGPELEAWKRVRLYREPSVTLRLVPRVSFSPYIVLLLFTALAAISAVAGVLLANMPEFSRKVIP